LYKYKAASISIVAMRVQETVYIKNWFYLLEIKLYLFTMIYYSFGTVHFLFLECFVK